MKLLKIGTIYQNLTVWLKHHSSNKSLSCTTGCCENKSIPIEQKNSIDLEIVKPNYESIACILTGSKLADRKKELQKEVFARLINTKEVESGYKFSFPYNEKFLLKMTEYIITEKRCCSFFNFEIKLHQSKSIQLYISGPKESKKMLELFLAEYN